MVLNLILLYCQSKTFLVSVPSQDKILSETILLPVNYVYDVLTAIVTTVCQLYVLTYNYELYVLTYNYYSLFG